MNETEVYYHGRLVPPGSEMAKQLREQFAFTPYPACVPLTGKQAEEFVARLREACRGGEIRLLTPLPRRVRLRLAVARNADDAAIWLVTRKRHGLARRLWRVTGLLTGLR